ncbi:MAG: hypothetical protein OXU98_06490 [Gammaproteobacteria bacterium]|nr:hypothetical protein [Gammaproteobacteria bacterium]
MISAMDAHQIQAVIRGEIARQKTNPYRVAREAGLPENAVRYAAEGRDSRLSRLVAIADALGLEFRLGPPDAAGASGAVADAGAAWGAADPRLAEFFAQLTDEWRRQNKHGRRALLTRLYAHFPELQRGA